MKVIITFTKQMMKNGAIRNVGDELEVDATTAILLAEKDCATINGYDIVTRTVEQEIKELIPKE